ncbi:chemotaxis protein CheW [Komagataeibacter xylinus]|nr:CheW protein [Komagataeibacter xylinus E25]RFP02519.1 chemotaxis protein CheW [Komagataeibacter xylinus]RFP06290.1 chemotaxis protein CheW [Komagataeibacter xylinus]
MAEGEVTPPSGRDAFARRVLRERARIMATRGQERMAGSAGRLLVMLDLAGQACGVDLHAVLRVTDPVWSDMPRRPDCPPGVRGVHGYQADLYTVFDLSVLLGGVPLENPGVMLLLRSVSSIPLGRVALLASGAAGTVEITGTPTPLTPSGFPQASLPDGRSLTVIDPARLFSSRYVGE